MAMKKNTKDKDKFKVVIMGGEGPDRQAEERTIQILDDKGKAFNLKQLETTIKSVRENQEDKCKDIASLGGGLLNSNAEVHGFMIGWITSKIIQAHEETQKTKCHINVTEVKELSREDLMLDTAKSLEEMAKHIKDNIGNDDVNIEQLPTNPFNGLSQYDE